MKKELPKTKKYRVHFITTEVGFVDVYAENKEQAEEFGIIEANEGGAMWLDQKVEVSNITLHQ